MSALGGGHEDVGRGEQVRDDARGSPASSSDKLGEELSPCSRRIRGPDRRKEEERERERK